MYCYGVDVVFYLICGGFIEEDIENVLIDLNFLNIKNVLVLWGDVWKFEGKFIFEVGGYVYVLDLIKQIDDMNKGKYLDINIENGEKIDFCIGIVGYFEKYFEVFNMGLDL